MKYYLSKWSITILMAIQIMFFLFWSHVHIGTAKSNYKNSSLKYILQWTLPDTIPFIYMGKGQETFIKNNCSAQNCFVTPDKSYFDDITEFDVVLIHGPEIARENLKMPESRSLKQKYVFVSIESSHYYPVTDEKYQDFFNWTWTYRLDSDEPYLYITIRNKEGDIIGPNKIMHWKNVKDMEPIDDVIKNKLKAKRKAAAWFVSNCYSKSKREVKAEELARELKKYGLEIDIYGKCGTKKCPVESMNSCMKKIERDYYFYLAFENSFSEDYVTEKLLHALQNYAVPVVFGAANYTRFMPDGIYLDAMELGVSELAKQMNDIILNKDLYYDFFKWHNYYSYHSRDEAPDTDDYCRFCALVNNEEMMSRHSVYENFIEWWKGHPNIRSRASRLIPFPRNILNFF